MHTRIVKTIADPRAPPPCQHGAESSHDTGRRFDVYYDKGSSFRLKRFLNDGKKNGHFFFYMIFVGYRVDHGIFSSAIKQV